MKLRNIHENEYAGLEDADKFEEPYPHFADCIDCTYPVLDPDINDQEDDREARQSRWCTKCGYAVCLDCVHGTADYVTCGSCDPITESEYDGLEDADEFGGDVEFMGEAHLGPHIFRVWYHKRQDVISMEINGYEFGYFTEHDHIPEKMKQDIKHKFIELRKDLLPHVRSSSVNGQIMDIGLALVQNQ